MPIITEKIENILKNKNLSRYKLNQIINYNESSLNHMINGKRAFTEEAKEKILPVLEISREEFESWILADKYPKEVIKLAIQIKKESKNNDKLILTAKIDEILQNRNMSRTQLSKLAKYDQSSVNKMLTGKESFSKTVLTKLSTALEIPENEIKSWIIADKYPLQILESALNIPKDVC